MTVFKNSGEWDTSNVSFDSGKVSEYNKRYPKRSMNYIDYGLSVLSAALLKKYPEGHRFDLGDLFHQVSLEQGLA